MERIDPADKVAPRAVKRTVAGDLRPIRDEADLARALDLLRSRDRKLIDRLIADSGIPPLRLRPGDFGGLVWIVVSQQVSTASANAIHARVLAAFPTLTPAAVQAASEADLRACGLSAPKIRTLRAIVEAIESGRLDFEALARQPAEAAHAALVAIKGIGPWTADIFLLSCLGHPDAWPSGDLALQEAARMALGLDERPNARALETIGARWRPVRAVAARVLWAWYRVAKSPALRSPPTEA